MGGSKRGKRQPSASKDVSIVEIERTIQEAQTHFAEADKLIAKKARLMETIQATRESTRIANRKANASTKASQESVCKPSNKAANKPTPKKAQKAQVTPPSRAGKKVLPVLAPKTPKKGKTKVPPVEPLAHPEGEPGQAAEVELDNNPVGLQAALAPGALLEPDLDGEVAQVGVDNLAPSTGAAAAPNLAAPLVAQQPEVAIPVSNAAKQALKDLMSTINKPGYAGPKSASSSEGNRKPILANETITPIKNLNGTGVIKGLIVSKQTRSKFTSKTGYNGWIFSAIIKDATGYLKLTFADRAEQAFYDRIHRGRSFYFEITSPGMLRPANVTYNKTGHKYEVKCPADMPFLEVAQSDIVMISDRVKLADLPNLPKGEDQVSNISMIVIQVGDIKTIMKRDQSSNVSARELLCLDASVGLCPEYLVKVTLWAENALISLTVGDIITMPLANIVRDRETGDISGLNNFHDTTVTVNQVDIPYVQQLRQHAKDLLG